MNAATGDIVWDDIQPLVPSTTAYGLHASASGLYAAGRPGLSRYTPDGDEVWTLDDAANEITSLSDVLLHEGIVYAVGSGPSDNGILVRISEDGDILWSESFTWADDVWAEMVVANPGGGVVVVGRLDPGTFVNDDIWIVTCDAKSCTADYIEVENEDTLHGFAIDASGQWIINVDDELVAMSPDGTENWTYATDFPGLYSVDHRKMLAIDGNGTILVAGGDPFDLRRITADQLPPA